MELIIKGNANEIKKVLHAIAGSEEHQNVVTKSELNKILKGYAKWH